MRIILRKWPDSPHYEWEVDSLGQDEFGMWYGCLGGTAWTRGPANGSFHTDCLFIVPADSSSWWLAELTAEPNGIGFYAHVCTPPSIEGDSITAVDLDLDVIRQPDDQATLLDEDEFAVNSLSLEYPAKMIEKAVATSQELMTMASAWQKLLVQATEHWFPALKRASSTHFRVDGSMNR